MHYRRSFRVNSIFWAIAFATLSYGQALRIGEHHWPTPNRTFDVHGGMEGVVQPTVSGKLSSALFGCVRNSGHRFHEGVDLKAISRDARNEPIDPVYAFEDGIVRYVTRSAGSSGYGRYIVIEHPTIAPGVVSLYAHLRSVPSEVQPGVAVEGGQVIGTMGRSAGGYSIPRSRAHLHFELGFWMGPEFQTWYDRQPFGSKNEHGSYNGLNIIGADVWDLFRSLRAGESRDAWEFIQSEPVAVQAFVRSTSIPELLEVNPHLMENVTLPKGHVGWRIQFTWYGMPVSFRALIEAEMPSDDYIDTVVLRPDLLQDMHCMDMVRSGSLGGPGKKLRGVLGRLFLND